MTGAAAADALPDAAPAGAGELELKAITVRFGGLTALDAVTFEVPQGSVVGVIGPNGAGKTTLFNVICGFVRPEAGRALFCGKPLDRVRPHQLAELGIRRTLQGVRMFANLTALENVMVGGDHLHRSGVLMGLLGLPAADRRERELRAAALDALEAAGVADVADRPAGALPYGVQKRIALARALVGRPRLLMLDEPAGGLGADDVGELAGVVRGFGGSVTVILVEHRMDLVMSVCEQVVVLDSGRVIANGPPAAVQRDPAVLDAYLGTTETEAGGDA